MIPNHELLDGLTLTDFTEKATVSFSFFCGRVLGLDIQPYHIEWFQDFYNKERTCIQAHRGSGKTTILGVAFSLFMILRDDIERKRRINYAPLKIMIVSNTQKQSKRIIREINSYVNRFEFLNWMKPKRYEKTWSKTELQTTNDCIIYAETYNENMRGEHVQYILMDEASLYQDTSIYFGAVEPMAAFHNGHIMVIGTPMTEIDLLSRLCKEGSGYYYKKYPAIQEGKPIWQSKYPITKLKEIENRIPPQEYAREYMLQVSDTEERLIPHSILLKSMDPNQSLTNQGDGNGSMYYMGTDLASSPKGDYTSVTVLEKDKDERIIVRYQNRFRGMDFTSHINTLCEIYRRFSPMDWLIDSSAFGSQLVNEIRVKEQIPANSFNFNARNRMEILGNLSRLFYNGQIIIPREGRDAFTTSQTDILIKELSGMVPSKTKTGLTTYSSLTKHDDTVMSMALAAHAASKLKSVDGIYMVAW